MATSFDPDDPGPAFDRFMAAPSGHAHRAPTRWVASRSHPSASPTIHPCAVSAEVITWADSYKAKHAGSGGHVAICHVDGGQWLTFYGTATVSNEPDEVAEAVERYANRYRQPKERDDRVVIVVEVDRIIGRLAD
ncbi:MAG: hypothetical protein R2710_11915 [Acidimicrobiales bacterium]